MKVLAHNYNGVLDDVLPHLDLVQDILSADIYLSWQDIDPQFVNLYKSAKALGKKSFLMSHCYGSCTHYLAPNTYTPLADRYLVWGQYDFELAQKAFMGRRTIITGSPIFGHVKPKVAHEETNIVFCPYHNDVELEESLQIAEELSSYDATVYTKVLSDCTHLYHNIVVTNRNKPGHIETTFDLLSEADVVVVNDPISTFVLLAFAAGVPVISVVEERRLTNLIGQSQKNIKDALQTGVTETTIKNLHTTLDSVLANDTKKEQRAYWCEYMGVNIKNPIENILNAINS